MSTIIFPDLQKAREHFASKFRAASLAEFHHIAWEVSRRIENEAAAVDFRDATLALSLAKEWDGSFGLTGTSLKMHATINRRKASFDKLTRDGVLRSIGSLLAGWNLVPQPRGCSRIHSHGLADLTLTLSHEDCMAAYEHAQRFTAEARTILAIEHAELAAKHDAERSYTFTDEVAEARKAAEAKEHREIRKAEKFTGRSQLPVDSLPLFAGEAK
jgi:hypothetical protein